MLRKLTIEEINLIDFEYSFSVQIFWVSHQENTITYIWEEEYFFRSLD